jgi:feruloyl esterase
MKPYAVALILTAPLFAQQNCADLTHLTVANTAIKTATPVPAGDLRLGNRPEKVAAFCRVAGVIGKEIGFELWLPAQWNGKYVAVGNGGLAGSIPLNAMVEPLNRGYAVGGTDTGHEAASDDGTWALGHPDRVLNYASLGVHLMAEADKAIVNAFYKAAPARSYFNGCSYGGKQALTEAQRYPADFNGIIAGDPANNYVRHYIAGHLWDALAVDGDGYLPPAKVTLLGNAVNDKCDALDGVKDGVLSDPRRCHFDPAVLQCKGADQPGCLTAGQVNAVKKLWGGLRNPDGTQFYPGLMPGGEAEPGGFLRYMSGDGPGKGRHGALTNAFFRYMVFDNPNWDYHAFRFTAPAGSESDIAITMRKTSAILDATDPDLRPFRANGGKLIHYHGWSDPDIPPMNSINYYESVASLIPGTDQFYRLFLVPGMQHCTGGPGTSQFDPLTALELWVEKDQAPASIPAAHLTAGKVTRTRPLCPYPLEAKYKGTGSTDDAANFRCEK